MVEFDRHLFGPIKKSDRVYFLCDRLGRDVLNADDPATRVSMTIGLVGVALSLILGIMIGGISGFFGGFIDLGIQRMIEICSPFLRFRCGLV